ncbi:TIM-barrel domain-containing protein [Massilia sp. Root335]|uniref:TIM-barrel domain-containing protein n=1 Tax=Massilia sp. Root335 TaxID=1736517 RepID=UPI0006FF5A80|nr:TIM-barrel domain-containing protein [Massilia sp. Root335]KQV49590.1 glycosyl hydrolase [Massilia sp. Root335]
MPFRCTLLLILSATLTPALAADRHLISWSQHDGRLDLTVSDGVVRIQPYTDKIVETTFVPAGERFDPVSHAVVLKPAALPARAAVRERDGGLEFDLGALGVTVRRAPFAISYTYRGQPLTAEKHGYARTAQGERIDFTLTPDETIYGAGGRVLGMNRRGYRLPLYNKAHYGYETHSEQVAYALPLVLSSRLYAIHFDNPQRGDVDIDSRHDDTLAFEVRGGRSTYQVIAADSWPELLASYTALTGRQPMPPRWALGSFASRFGYHSEAEARATVDKYIAAGIPLDAIIFDIYWYGVDMKGQVGNLEFTKERFPDARKMMADFAAKGVKTIVSIEPYVMTASKRWQEALRRDVLAKGPDGKPLVYDVYFGRTGLIDIFKPAARDWFWERYKDLHAQGVAGCFCDLGEPEGHPSAMRHQTGSADQVHNLYGHEWARMMADGYRRDYPNERPFILARAGYSGSQRYGLIPSSGDSNRTWGGLQGQPELSLQMGMQGVAYMHSDLGGFAGANLDDELYARWMQYGTFQPVFRPHGQEEVASEPVYRAPAPMAAARAAARLRYRLLPYNYTLAFDNHVSGMPLMRPLMFDEPDNPALRLVSDTYLWGDDMLVSPVLTSHAQRQPVYLPRRGPWFDFATDREYAGGTIHMVDLVPDHIPVFVRAGAFIGEVEPVQSTRDYSLAKLAVHYYHDPAVHAGHGKIYDDDGSTPDAFERGQYQVLHFASRLSGNALTIELSDETGKHYTPAPREVSVIIHNIGTRPAGVSLDGRALPFEWDGQRRRLALALPSMRANTGLLRIALAPADERP